MPSQISGAAVREKALAAISRVAVGVDGAGQAALDLALADDALRHRVGRGADAVAGATVREVALHERGVHVVGEPIAVVVDARLQVSFIGRRRQADVGSPHRPASPRPWARPRRSARDVGGRVLAVLLAGVRPGGRVDGEGRALVAAGRGGHEGHPHDDEVRVAVTDRGPPEA